MSSRGLGSQETIAACVSTGGDQCGNTQYVHTALAVVKEFPLKIKAMDVLTLYLYILHLANVHILTRLFYSNIVVRSLCL